MKSNLIKFKGFFIFICSILAVFCFIGAVSAASLTVDEVGYGSSSVMNHTLENDHKIPGYVRVNGKNSTSSSFLYTLTKSTVELSQNTKTDITISSVGAAPSPSYSASGNLTKSQYVTVAGNITNFISSNGRAPNYIGSPLGNIRYESLVYYYAKIVHYYWIYDTLPSTMNVMACSGTTGGVNIQDTTKPTATASLATGSYNSTKSVTLTASDNVDSSPDIYYTTNGNTPTTSSTKYSSPLSIATTTTLKFIAVDEINNICSVQTRTYTIDKTPPTVTANLISGVYNVAKSVILTAADNIDSSPTIYYTTNGSTPTASSTTYTAPISITKTTTLKFMARDDAGNQAAVQTNTCYFSIQEAVDAASNFATIRVNNGTYIENIIVDKPLTILPFSGVNVIVQAKDAFNDVFGIGSDGSGSKIQGFTIKGAIHTCGIYLYQATGCNLTGNNIINNLNGIYLAYSNENIISQNILTNNSLRGITIIGNNTNTSCNNTVQGNSLTENECGIGLHLANNNILSENSIAFNEIGMFIDLSNNNILSENSLTHNDIGIYLNTSNINDLSGNIVTDNLESGISLDYSNDNNLSENIITDNLDGIALSCSHYNYLNGNSVVNNTEYGIAIENSISNEIIENTVTGNTYGITLNYSPTNINFNRIYGNSLLGLFNVYSNYVDATNNWWGTNNPTIISNLHASNSSRDINNLGGNLLYNPWLVTMVYSTVTHKGFESIQEAIDDPLTRDGDVIVVTTGIYVENVVINKKLTLVSEGNATIQALNSSNPTVTINNCNDVTISGFTITGSNSSAIYLNNANNCYIINATLTTNGNGYGVYVGPGSNCTVTENTVLNNSFGIYLDHSIAFISGNNITNNVYGVYVDGTSSKSGFGLDSFISGNNVTGNDVGIYVDDNPDDVFINGNDISNNANYGVYLCNFSLVDLHFNRIVGNGQYGLYNEGQLFCIADNNWWGTNNPTIGNSPCDIYASGMDIYDPWLVLSLAGSTITVTQNNTSDSEVAADLTHNNRGDDTSSSGTIPDGLPVNFTTTLGTISNTGYTRNGKVILTLNTGTTTSGTANITISFDDQNVQTRIIIDKVAPTVGASLFSGLYNSTQYVNLTASDNLDSNPFIYYTLDGNTPTTSSLIYTGPICINTNIILKFMAVDFAGNQAPVMTEYYILSDVENLNTGKGYSTIQEAIDDPLTVDGDVIVVKPGIYTENIVLNKSLTLKPSSGNVTINAADANSPVITINFDGSGSTITGFNITGSILDSGVYFNQTNNCTVSSNNLTNNYYGMFLFTSSDNMIYDNNLTSNLMDGINLNTSDNNIIYSNFIIDNSGNGIYIYNSQNTLIMANTIQNNLINGIELNNSSNDTIYENTITENHENGIKNTYSVVDIHFNIITGNSMYGLYNNGGLNKAENNWWGTNYPILVSDNGNADGAVSYDPWLVLSLTSSPITVTQSSMTNSSITADLIHNNHGDDTSSSGIIPDGLSVNISGMIKTITKGKATAIIISSTSSPVTVIAAVDNEAVILVYKSFSSIQEAVSDPLTVDGDVIVVTNGTYIENVVINKNLTLISEGNVTIQALNPTNPTITINNCSNVTIYGFTITGSNSSAIYLNNANNCHIINDTLTTNDNGDGIYIGHNLNCTITENTISNNSIGIYLDHSIAFISGNNITNNSYGIYVNDMSSKSTFGSDSSILKNNVTGNDVGICIDNNSYDVIINGNDISNNVDYGVYLRNLSVVDLHFNRIVGNGQYGLYDETGLCFAENNWWGTNNPFSAIYSTGGAFYDPCLVLTATPTSYKVADGEIYESTITADLNHNSNGEYPSTLIHVPDGIPINFTTNSGNITSTGYTSGGEASANLILDPNTQSITNTTATADGQSVSTTVDRSANAIIYINSTATDLSTGLPLSLYYELPLNESVSWVSVLWKSTNPNFGTFQNEVDLIVNGEVVLSRNVTNSLYANLTDYYSENVFYTINYLNWLFSNSAYSQNTLQSIIYLNPQLQNLTGSDLEAAILNLLMVENNFSADEMQLVSSYKNFEDDIKIYIDYPGDASQRITFEDPDNGEVTSLDFGGNYILRESTMIYANGGYYHVYGDDPLNPTSVLYKDAGYEGVRSFAIVTTEVTDEILQYWLDQENKTDINGTLLYPDGPMRAAYGTFLTALSMIKAHDMVADQAAISYNVTWMRTTPIVVSVYDDAYSTTMTLECDHRFGMDVVGDPDDVLAFRFACSSAINPIEHWVMETLFPGYNSTSITIGLGEEILNGQMPDIFMSNGYLIMKSEDNTLFLVFDPQTGILRDVMTFTTPNFGAGCYSDQQTDWASDLGNMLLSNMDLSPSWMNFIPILSMGINPLGMSMGFSPLNYEMKTRLAGLFVSLGITMPVAEALAGSTTFARNPLSAALIATFIVTFVAGNYICDQYGWVPPRDFNKDCETVKEFLIMYLSGGWWDDKRIINKQKKTDRQKVEDEISAKLLHLDNLNIGDGPDSSKLFKALILIGTGAVITYKVLELVDMRIIYNFLLNETNSTNNGSIYPQL